MKKYLLFVVLLLMISCTARQLALDQRSPEDAAEVLSAENATPAVTVESPPEARETMPAPSDEDLRQKVIAQQEQRIEESLAHPEKFAPRNHTNEVGELIEAAEPSLQSYQFRTSKGTFYVRGGVVRYLLLSPILKHNVARDSVNYTELYLDEIIVDRNAKTAKAYCFGFTDTTRKQCARLQLADIDFDMQYDVANPKLPEDWAREFASKEVTASDEQKYYLNSIETTRLQFPNGGELYMLPKAGLPIKVVVSPLEGYTFDNFVINQVRPEDITHRSKTDIPPQEAFYKNY